MATPEKLDIPAQNPGAISIGVPVPDLARSVDIAAPTAEKMSLARRWGIQATLIMFGVGSGFFVWGEGWSHDGAAELGKYLVVGAASVIFALAKE